MNNSALENANKELYERLEIMGKTFNENEFLHKNRISELELMLCNLRKEIDELKKNKMIKQIEDINNLKIFYDSQLASIKENHSEQIQKQKIDYENKLESLRNELSHLDSHHGLVSSTREDLNLKRFREIEEMLTNERNKKSLYILDNEKKLADLNSKILELGKKNDNLQKKIIEYESHVKDLNSQNNLFYKENKSLRSLIKEKENMILKFIDGNNEDKFKDKQMIEDLLLQVSELENLNKRLQREINQNENNKKYFDLYANLKLENDKMVIECQALKNRVSYFKNKIEESNIENEKNLNYYNAQILEYSFKNEKTLSDKALINDKLNEKNSKLNLIQKQMDLLSQKLKEFPLHGCNVIHKETIFISSQRQSIQFETTNNIFDNNFSATPDLRLKSTNKNWETQLSIFRQTNLELEEKTILLKEKIKHLENINSQMQLKLSKIHDEQILNQEKDYDEILSRDQLTSELQTKILQLHNQLNSQVKINEHLQEQISKYSLRIEEYQYLLGKTSYEEKKKLLLENLHKTSSYEHAFEYEFLDFIENDFSSLLLINRNNFSLIKSWLPNNFVNLSSGKIIENFDIKFNLLFKASIHGYKAINFAEKCHGKENTLTIILTSLGKLVGAFTPLKWLLDDRENSFYITDFYKKSFLFSLDLKQKFDLIEEEYAIYCFPKFGPVFGKGKDLEILEDCNNNENSASGIGNSYMIPFNITGKDIFGDEKYFVVDYEVYSILISG